MSKVVFLKSFQLCLFFVDAFVSANFEVRLKLYSAPKNPTSATSCPVKLSTNSGKPAGRGGSAYNATEVALLDPQRKHDLTQLAKAKRARVGEFRVISVLKAEA